MSGIKVFYDKGVSLSILGIYRPPNAPLNEALARMTDAMDRLPQGNNSLICIAGDFNVNSLNKFHHDTLRLQEFLASYDIERLDLPPTRITSGSFTSIDAVCTNLDRTKIEVEVIHTLISDHTGQHCTLMIPSTEKQPPSSRRRHFNIQNLNSLKHTLASQTWDKIIQAHDAQTAYSYFKNILTFALDSACPYKTSRNQPRGRHKVSISSPDVDELRKRFAKAQEKHILTGSVEDRHEVVLRKKAYDLGLRTLRRQATENVITESSNKTKAIWKIINDERSSRKKTEELKWQLNIAGRMVDDINEIAELFNAYFTSIADETLKANDNLKTNTPTNRLNPILFLPENTLADFKPTTCQEVIYIIRKLKISSSAGFDDINSKLLKFCAEELCLPMTNFINKSLTQGIFPAEFKLSKVYPLYKQGKRDDIKNFRPISLLSSVSKVMEKIVLSQLMQHLCTNNLFPAGQHGFIPGKSTATALVELVEKIIDHLDNGSTVSGMFLDLSKAFDCLDHSLILRKLDNLGIKSTAHKWFKDYLIGRSQIVELKTNINGTTSTARSKARKITRGVPQGSVLGPVLFILFTYDFPKFMEQYSHVVMFADDSVLLTNSRSAEALEISTFISVNMAHDYCIKNDLVFNENKTNQLIWGRLRDELSGPPNIMTVESTKHLGVMLDNGLAWKDHIDSLCLKLNTALFVIKRIKAVGTEAATLTAYHALFESHIRYGVVLWGGSSTGNLSRVLTIQKRALRIMAGLQPQDSCRQVFRDLNILTITSIYIIEAIMYACSQELTKNGDIHGLHTRHAQDFSLPRHRTTLFTKKPSYSGAKLFNLLPPTLKNDNPKTLKRRLIKWLIGESLYSLEEFSMSIERFQSI